MSLAIMKSFMPYPCSVCHNLKTSLSSLSLSLLHWLSFFHVSASVPVGSCRSSPGRGRTWTWAGCGWRWRIPSAAPVGPEWGSAWTTSPSWPACFPPSGPWRAAGWRWAWGLRCSWRIWVNAPRWCCSPADAVWEPPDCPTRPCPATSCWEGYDMPPLTARRQAELAPRPPNHHLSSRSLRD